jgi:endonuclease V-like protein UPF0215 family
LIKRETRILGLSGGNGKSESIPVIGIVFRGSLWLDSVLTCQVTRRQRDYLSGLVQAVLGLKQYSQIRAVILQGEELVSGTRMRLSELSRETNLPVISIVELKGRTRASNPKIRQAETNSNADSFPIQLHGGVVCVKAVGMGQKETCKVLDVACATGQLIPEALRVAQVVARHVTKHGVLPEAM